MPAHLLIDGSTRVGSGHAVREKRDDGDDPVATGVYSRHPSQHDVGPARSQSLDYLGRLLRVDPAVAEYRDPGSARTEIRQPGSVFDERCQRSSARVGRPPVLEIDNERGACRGGESERGYGSENTPTCGFHHERRQLPSPCRAGKQPERIDRAAAIQGV